MRIRLPGGVGGGQAQSCHLDPIGLVSELLVRHRNDLHQTLLQADFE